MAMRLPLIPTIIVGAAVAVMIGLGIWQLQRADWKEALLTQFRQASAQPEIAWPAVPPQGDDLYYRRAAGYCLEVVGWRAVAGRSRNGQSGWSHIAECRTGGAEGPGMQAEMGWSRSPEPSISWKGGEVRGVIAPDGRHKIRLVSNEPAPGLDLGAVPTPEGVPNNHLMYAVQWFFFAAVAAVIYFLALRWRRPRVAGQDDNR
jgi:surfeit locus 1 family protein